MSLSKEDISDIVKTVLDRMGSGNSVPADREKRFNSGADGMFDKMEEAIEAAYISQRQLATISLEKRKEFIAAIREMILKNVDEIGKRSVAESGLGKVADKIQKNILAAKKTPGVEEIEPKVYTGDHGLTLVERAPYGVIGAITPSTNPTETVICNGIGMIAAGNSVVFNSHPSAQKVTQFTIELINRAITGAGGPPNLLCGVYQPTKETSEVLMKHPKIRLLVVTGGPEIVRIAMNSGKKVIAAGPGNPPVVVDETADIDYAAKNIVDGAAFDNNVLCIAEKEVFVVDQVADQLINSMTKYGAIKLTSSQLEQLMPHISIKNCRGELITNKKYVGKDVQVILETIGLSVASDIKLAIVEAAKNHPLVYLEQLMPVLPIVRVRNVHEAIDEAYKAEQNNFHTAMMYSKNVDNLTKMARVINTTIFVKNAPSYSGLGMNGEGFTSYTLASPTGEGVTSPISFTRQRRCVLKDQFRIV